MTITCIKRKKGKYYSVFVDDNFLGLFHEDILATFKIKQGGCYSDEQIENLKSAGEVKFAKDRALFLLGYRDHSKKELIDKLCKNVSKKVANSTADRMEELGLIDDFKYAKNLAKKLISVKCRGKKRVLWEITAKGIDQKTALEAIDTIEVDTVDQIISIINKKYLNKLRDINSRQKVFLSLARQGHSFDDINKAIDILSKQLND